MQYGKGALKPLVDVRDFKVAAVAKTYLPETFSYEEITDVKDQEDVNSCVAHAASTVLETLNQVETSQIVKLSTDYIYGMQGIAYDRYDQGMFLRDACKIVKDYGDPLESSVKGNTEQPQCALNLSKILTGTIEKEASNFKVLSYASCNSIDSVKSALFQFSPILASVKWHDRYDTGGKVIKMDESTDYGYHAIVIYGYCSQGWMCQNSWGKSWNKDGRFILPYSYKLEEAWSFVDAESHWIDKPKRNKFMDLIYKIINFLANLFRKKD